jgi:hypothetical protein
MHGGTIPAILRRAASETVFVVHRGPALPAVHDLVPGNSNFWHFALRPLGFFKINLQSLILQLGPQN